MPLRPQPDEFSDRELSVGYWITRHRILFHRLHIAWWSLFAIGSLTMFALIFINWLTHRAQTEEIWRSFPTNGINVRVIPAPQPIAITQSDVVTHDTGTVDVLFIVENVNTEWAARVVPYDIIVGGASVGSATVSLAPKEQKALMKSQLAVPGDTLPTVRLVVDEQGLEWQHRSMNDPSLPVVSFESTTSPLRAIQSNQENNPFHSEMTITLRNKSVFGFREVQVVVRIIDEKGNAAALASTYFDQVDSLATKELVFRWPARLSPALKPVVIVNVDRLDESRILR